MGVGSFRSYCIGCDAFHDVALEGFYLEGMCTDGRVRQDMVGIVLQPEKGKSITHLPFQIVANPAEGSITIIQTFKGETVFSQTIKAPKLVWGEPTDKGTPATGLDYG